MPSSEASYETARRLRRKQTPAEQILWRHLRGKRMCNVKFRRQHPIGPYVVDFYCHSARLAIELDGMTHEGTAKADAQRSAHLKQAGVHVLRVLNDEIISDPEVVAEWIAKEAAKLVQADEDGGSARRQTALTPALSRREREHLN
jgi:very-short-patch-repair endonuclease